jgi:hypothetical protein
MSLFLPIVLAVVIPAGISFLVLLIGWLARRQDGTGALSWWSVLAGVGAGYVSGHLYVSGWPGFPPADATHWLAFMAMVAIAAGLVCETSRRAAVLGVGRCVVALSVGTVLGVCLGKSQQASTAVVAGLVVVAANLELFWAVLTLHSGLFRG